jgi:hypothetical protein
MPGSARDAARTLELILRAAAAEERLLARRLDQVADEQRRARAEIEREFRHEHFGRSPNGNGAGPTTGDVAGADGGDALPDQNGRP